MTKEDRDKLIELIDSVKAVNLCDSVELIGSELSFDILKQSGFPLKDFKCHEILFDKSEIMIIPTKTSKSIKIVYSGKR